MKKILNKICQEKEISASALSILLGRSRGFVKSVNQDAKEGILCKLLTMYPNLNPYYLIKGEGEPFIDINSRSNLASLAVANTDYLTLFESVSEMYQQVLTENAKLRSVNMNLIKQNERLVKENNSLKNNE